MLRLLQENKNNESNNKTNNNKFCQKLCYSLDVQKWKHTVVILRERKSHQNYHGAEPERQYLEKGLWEEGSKEVATRKMHLTWALNGDSAFNEWERAYQRGRISIHNETDNSVLGEIQVAGIQWRGNRCQLQAFWEMLRVCHGGLFWWAEEGFQLNNLILSVLWEDCNLC